MFLNLTGPVALSTSCKLIAPGAAINGTMSITKTEMYFEMDEENEENKKLDAQVLTLCLCLTCVSPGKSNQLIQVFCAKGKCVGNQVSVFLKRMADILRWFVQDIGNTEVDSG